MRIVKAREAKKNMAYDPEKDEEKELLYKARAPEIEHFNRGFNEASRYYNCFGYQRKHGLKYVPPPKAEYL